MNRASAEKFPGEGAIEKESSRNCTVKPPSSLSVVVRGRTGLASWVHLK